MNLEFDGHNSDPFGSSLGINEQYEPSVASSASSSQPSVFSDSLSVQSSIASSVSDDFRLTQEDARERDRVCAQAQLRYQTQNSAPTEEPSVIGKLITENYTNTYAHPSLTYADVTSSAVQPRPNPRRSSSSRCQRPPPLVRQRDRKINFVDNLVDSAAQMVEVIWPLSVVPCSNAGNGGRGVLPLRTYIEETLRRSRTSYSTLQVALYYIVLIKPYVPQKNFTMEQGTDCFATRALMCGRRMFLAALILASKYLQDRNYSAKAWSKMSGLRVNEINSNERVFLEKIDWKLHIPKPTFETWQEVVLRYTPQPPSSPGVGAASCSSSWKRVVPLLNPELDNFLLSPRKSRSVVEWPTASLTASASTPTPTPTPTSAPVSAINFEDSKSQESTPTPATVLPRFLEPKPDIAPPTPLLAQMGPLPTPNMTPSSVASSTPAVSAYGSRRSSMCSAMAVVHNTGINRCILDSCPPGNELRYVSRRPSIMSSSSTCGSSPESLMSDHSRSSRASSVSSISTVSTTSSLAQPRTSLARLATCRNVRLPPPNLVKEEENEDGTELKPILIDDDIEMVTSPDMADFSISDRALHAPHRHSKHAAHAVPVAAVVDKSRKRCRSNGHHRRSELQEEVRYLLQESFDDEDDVMDIDDRVASPSPAAHQASSMLTKSHPNSLQREVQQTPPAYLSRSTSFRVPAVSQDGKKRTCLESQ